MTERRRYRVSGVDDLGDVHLFETDDLARAKGVRDAMSEDLGNVELLEDIDIADGTEPPQDYDRKLRSEPLG